MAQRANKDRRFPIAEGNMGNEPFATRTSVSMRRAWRATIAIGIAADDRPILAPVELERLARLKSQRNEGAPTNSLLFALSIFSPLSGKAGDAAIGTVKAQRDKIGLLSREGWDVTVHILSDKGIQLGIFAAPPAWRVRSIRNPSPRKSETSAAIP